MVFRKESRLDVLFNNAGVMGVPLSEFTTDGYDLQFGTNALGTSDSGSCHRRTGSSLPQDLITSRAS